MYIFVIHTGIYINMYLHMYILYTCPLLLKDSRFKVCMRQVYERHEMSLR